MIEGIVRESIGKKPTKALRRDGYLIANIYGKGVENVNAAFNSNEFIKAMRAKEGLAFDVKVGGKTYKVVVAEYQSDVVKGSLKHVDLRVVEDDVVTKFLIPVRTTGLAVGLKNKGVLVQSKRRLSIKCSGKDLIDEFVLDVSKLDLGDSLLVRDIKVPAGVTILDAEDVAVVGVLSTK